MLVGLHSSMTRLIYFINRNNHQVSCTPRHILCCNVIEIFFFVCIKVALKIYLCINCPYIEFGILYLNYENCYLNLKTFICIQKLIFQFFFYSITNNFI